MQTIKGLNKMTIENKYIIAASGDHLGKYLPDNFQEMSDENLHKFISENKIECNEHDDEAFTYEQIEYTAYTIKQFVENLTSDELGELIRKQGKACVIFDPDEFKGTDANTFQNLLTEAGNEIAGEL